MPTESKTLTEQRIRKEKALAGLRELQLAEAEGKLLRTDHVEAAWAGTVIKLRNAVLAIPSRARRSSLTRDMRSKSSAASASLR